MSSRTRLAARAHTWWAAAGLGYRVTDARAIRHYRFGRRFRRCDGPPPMWAWQDQPDDRIVRYDGRGTAYRRRQLARRRRNRRG